MAAAADFREFNEEVVAVADYPPGKARKSGPSAIGAAPQLVILASAEVDGLTYWLLAAGLAVGLGAAPVLGFQYPGSALMNASGT